jgi:hypothetical protein
MIAIHREFYCAHFNWAKAVSSFFDVEHLRHPIQRTLWLASLEIAEPVRNVVRFELIACADPENLAAAMRTLWPRSSTHGEPMHQISNPCQRTGKANKDF